MVSFTPKKIIRDKSLGEVLCHARQLKSLKIEEVAAKLKIKRSYIIALESEDFDSLPSGLYGKNFLKKYADFLKIEPVITANFLSQLPDIKTDNPFSQKVLKKRRFIIFPKILRNLLLTLFFLACLLYLIFYFNKITSPPELVVITPDKNLLLNEPFILVSGWTEKETEVQINGELLLSDTAGKFSKLIDLKKGVNTLQISAKKKYSRDNIVIRQILVE